MKNIYVQIEDPMGKILAEGMGANNTFSLNGETIGFTVKKEVAYENEAVPLCVYFSKGSEFAQGDYRVKVYEDRALIGQSTLSLK
jgi:cell division protein ZapB